MPTMPVVDSMEHAYRTARFLEPLLYGGETIRDNSCKRGKLG